jgi:hypothetical protein
VQRIDRFEGRKPVARSSKQTRQIDAKPIMQLKTFFWATLASTVLASVLFLFFVSALMLLQKWPR